MRTEKRSCGVTSGRWTATVGLDFDAEDRLDETRSHESAIFSATVDENLKLQTVHIKRATQDKGLVIFLVKEI